MEDFIREVERMKKVAIALFSTVVALDFVLAALAIMAR